MGDIFTAVSKFIMASTAFVATASIWLFCNVTSLGIVYIRQSKTIKVLFSTFHALCKLFMCHAVGHFGKMTSGYPCSHIEPAGCSDLSYFTSVLSHCTEVCHNYKSLTSLT